MRCLFISPVFRPAASRLLAISLAAACLLPGCAGGSFMRPRGAAPTPAQAQQQAEAAAAAAQAAQPFAMEALAVSNGVVRFNLTNSSPEPVSVEASDFGYIRTGTREQVPFDRATDRLDVGDRAFPVSLAPGETLSGKAVFEQIPAPVGNRFVFWKQSLGKGTFATVRAAR